MKEKYNIVAWVAVEVDADSVDDATKMAANQVREMRPKDFEFEVVKAEKEVKHELERPRCELQA